MPSRRRRRRKRWILPVRPSVLFSGIGIVLAIGLAYLFAGLEGGTPGTASTTVDERAIGADVSTDGGFTDTYDDGRRSVTLLSSDEFDATQIAPETVRIGGAEVSTRIDNGQYRTHQEDVDGDGWLDLVVEVETTDLSPDELRDGTAELTGSTLDGQAFRGEGRIDRQQAPQ